MKVGLLFECGQEGADKKICEAIVNAIQPKIEAVYRFAFRLNCAFGGNWWAVS